MSMIRFSRSTIADLLLAIVFLVPASLYARDPDYYLQIKGIPGESTDPDHPDWSDVESYSHRFSKSAVSGTPGTTPSVHQDFAVVKLVDRASPLLGEACCAGTRLTEMTFDLYTWTPAGDRKFAEFRFWDVVVTSVKPIGDYAEAKEEVTFSYGRIRWTYIRLNSQGQAVETIIREWDIARETQGSPTAASSSLMKLR